MKFIAASCSALLLALALAGCSSSAEDPSSSAEATSGEAADDLTSTGGPNKICPPHETVCVVANPYGVCVDKCVPEGVMCVKPTCRVCEAQGGPIRPGCHWSQAACEWQCPVCDPPPPPEKTGCSWDAKDCVWLCL